MHEVTAVQLRQSVRRVVRRIERDGEPVLLKLGRRPVGVIVSLRDFRERFALRVAEEERRRVIDDIKASAVRGGPAIQKVIDELRGRR